MCVSVVLEMLFTFPVEPWQPFSPGEQPTCQGGWEEKLGHVREVSLFSLSVQLFSLLLEGAFTSC